MICIERQTIDRLMYRPLAKDALMVFVRRRRRVFDRRCELAGRQAISSQIHRWDLARFLRAPEVIGICFGLDGSGQFWRQEIIDGARWSLVMLWSDHSGFGWHGFGRFWCRVRAPKGQYMASSVLGHWSDKPSKGLRSKRLGFGWRIFRRFWCRTIDGA